MNSEGLLLSGSWDQTVGAWDVRTKNICHRLNVGAKVFAMCVTPEQGPYGKLVVADSLKRLQIYDFRKFEKPEETRESVCLCGCVLYVNVCPVSTCCVCYVSLCRSRNLFVVLDAYVSVCVHLALNSLLSLQLNPQVPNTMCRIFR